MVKKVNCILVDDPRWDHRHRLRHSPRTSTLDMVCWVEDLAGPSPVWEELYCIMSPVAGSSEVLLYPFNCLRMPSHFGLGVAYTPPNENSYTDMYTVYISRYRCFIRCSHLPWSPRPTNCILGHCQGFTDAHFGLADFQMRQAALTQKIQGSAPGICQRAMGGADGLL